MKIRPQDYWRVLDTYLDARGTLLAYRLASSRILYDIDHKPLTRSEIERLVEGNVVDDDYPESESEIREELLRTICGGLVFPVTS